MKVIKPSVSASFVRVNGRGNAWPVFLGSNSKFYNVNSSEDLANASFSLINYEGEEFSTSQIKWEVLIDAGNHTVPFLIQNGNRLPEAVVLTHGHMDHTLGLDWVAQSSYYLSDKLNKMTVYATLPVWQFVIQSYPHLESIINYQELLPGKSVVIKEVGELSVTAYPVYHGEHAKGASMLFFETTDKKSVVFTGDMLCPLLRKKDYKTIAKASAVFIDSNNRFPFPESNHGSIVTSSSENNAISSFLSDWLLKTSLEKLISPHQRSDNNPVHQQYFEDFLQDFTEVSSIPHTVLDFSKIISKPNFYLIHYGGMEDMKHHKQKDLSTKELEAWTTKSMHREGISDTSFIVPETGDIIAL